MIGPEGALAIPWAPRRNGGWTYVAEIGAEGASDGIVRWLANRYEHSDEATWSERLLRGELRLGDAVLHEDRPGAPGALVLWSRPPWDEDPAPRGYTLAAEGPGWFAVDKPMGLPTMPSGGWLENTLLHVVRERWPTATPMHRLGAGTSGLVLFAGDGAARTALTAAFREGRIERRYLAVASGLVPTEPTVIDAPIGPVPHDALGSIHAVTASGRPARTTVRAIAHAGESTLVDVEIHSGRPHQIRAHLAWFGAPLRGDPLFKGGGSLQPGHRPTEAGYLLHAWRLAWDATISGGGVIERDPPWRTRWWED